MKTMKREEAVDKLASKKLQKLSEAARADQLESITMEDWSLTQGWDLLSKELLREFREGELNGPPNSKKYDPVLLIWLKDELQAVRNDFLAKQLNIDGVIGEPLKLEACPCCGCRTLDKRGDYNICRVCWWEDAGHDNDRTESSSGPNYGLNLAQGRYNFLTYGIYDPKRKDLIAIKETVDKYEKGRTFEIVGEYLIERNTNWRRAISSIGKR